MELILLRVKILYYGSLILIKCNKYFYAKYFFELFKIKKKKISMRSVCEFS